MWMRDVAKDTYLLLAVTVVSHLTTTIANFTLLGTRLCVRECNAVIRVHTGDCMSYQLLRFAWKIEAHLRRSDNTRCLWHVILDNVRVCDLWRCHNGVQAVVVLCSLLRQGGCCFRRALSPT
ncbi:hypothetical protein PoB_000101700 [Plakobranchus ocellatus]|uniref:Secreted protein n=1 Tax=Plakobranchus ocellatus TaxID=259542 RepID=A0AAV3XXD5_9GAST|nr:hypothetical protein PoB_000101700 [Plakobranchus ocellatus]